MRDGVPYGVAVWSSPEWRATAVAWLDERLAAAGLERRGKVEQPQRARDAYRLTSRQRSSRTSPPASRVSNAR